MGETFAELGDIVFSLVIGYLSAIEFIYVVRHLYHYSFNHDATAGGIDDAENLSQLQNSMRQQLANAKSKEAEAGTQVMKDGVHYKDGFRLDAQQALIDQLKEQLKDKELSDLKRKELEKELAAQIKIAERLRKELAEAEEKYQRQLKQEAEIKAKKLLDEQKQREQEERAKVEAEEKARKLAEAEKRKREEKDKERIQREEEEHKKAEEQARKLAEAEKQRELEQRQREEAEEQARKLAEGEKQRELEQRQREEAEEQARKLAEAEKQRELEQRQREEAEEQARKLAEAERQKVLEQRQREEIAENADKLLEAEKQKENEKCKLEEEQKRQQERLEIEKQKQIERQREEQELAEAEQNAHRLLELEKANEEKQAAAEAEAELAARNLLALEHRLEEQLRAAEKEADFTEKERQLIHSIKQREFTKDEGNEYKEAELLRKILEAREQLGEESEEEQTLRLIKRERDQETKQKRIEENALLFMEAEKEMAELQSRMLDAVERRQFTSNLDSAPNTPIVEEPCIKRNFSPLTGGESSYSTVKTQLAQDLDEPYSVRTKPLLFPGVSDDTSSIDPASSQQSSFSTQPSEEITTGTESQYRHRERQEPDGEDTALTNLHYSDDYLRSLDGIKQRPLVREDGSGRRRAFKKRRSSNSSNSSRDSRQSRDEELKMFTSLEEEEMKDTADSEFTPIRYTTEPTLKVKGHHRRHKRSPAKDSRRGDDSLRSSLERLGEETSDPWGEVKPEHYKHTEFWKREKTLSIDEEMEFEKPASSEEVAYETATNMPSASSFEEATQKQNQEALTALQKHSGQKDTQKGKQNAAKEESARSDNANLQSSQIAEKETSPAHASPSLRLQRSPRLEDINKYEDPSKETNDTSKNSPFRTPQSTPTISVQTPLDFGSWRDEHGLIMEGLSDFYDFTASVNPSRSRSASRNVSPANTAPNTPLPKNVSFLRKTSIQKEINKEALIEVYDDTGNINYNQEFKMENILKLIDGSDDQTQDNITMEKEIGVRNQIKYVADDNGKALTNQTTLVPLVNIIDDINVNEVPNVENNDSVEVNLNASASSSRSREAHMPRTRSRSKSPLPTPDNLKRSVENRRYKMIKHNEDILEKLIETKLLPELTSKKDIEEQSVLSKQENKNNSQDKKNDLVESLKVESRKSRSKSPMCLPTIENLSKGLEKRRNKLIERNDEFIKQLEERSQTPESPTIVVKHVYEMECSEETQNEEYLSSNEEDDDCSKEQMDLLVQSLRVARSKTKSKSPMIFKEIQNVYETSQSTTFYEYQHIERTTEQQQHQLENINVPTISINFSESETSKLSPNLKDEDSTSRANMELLIQSLRMARSRSTSKSPMYIKDTAKSPEPSDQRCRDSRSKSPSRSHSMSPKTSKAYRSHTPSRSLSPQPGYCDDFEVLLNLEGSTNRTPSITTVEQEALLVANRQKQLDEEALETLKNAADETEIRTLAPLILDRDELKEQEDYLTELPLTEKIKLLRNSPTTPDYERTISEEMRDVERIKRERLEKGFKRSTYVGESMDLGSEFEPLRREAARFQRSRSPSPSCSTIESAAAQRNAKENRKIQDLILSELASSSAADNKGCRNTGAIPKAERLSSSEVESPINNEMEEEKRIKEEKHENLDELRRRNAVFRRSASTSRSPLRDSQLEELASIEVEAAKRVLKDKFLDNVCYTASKLQDFSRHFNANFFNNERRASDPASTKIPHISVEHNDDDVDLEPEEYHHFRRFSLAQEAPVEQYPHDDYIFIEQVEVRTRSGSRTWLREDFYSESVDDYLAKSEQTQENVKIQENSETVSGENYDDDDQHQEEHVPEADDDEEYSNASDDDRQTVVEVDDEIEEDISDFNERGPAEESHHETSECEEAEREMDRYAGREASDWNREINMDNILTSEPVEEDEGAVGGVSNSPYDSDSLAIDQIYDEAIKNRKQSGILREYDSILMQMSANSNIDEQYLIWSKTNDKNKPKNIEFNTQFLDNERKDAEMRYLGDANISARQSARLRSRYGYNPILQAKCLDDDMQVDLNYKPKREYNWRKNFKLDEDIVKEDKEITLDEIINSNKDYNETVEERLWQEKNDNEEQMMDARKFSLGGESITLFSRSPEKDISTSLIKKEQCEPKEELIKGSSLSKEEKLEKPKKKKTKKKSHKETKASLEETMNKEDEDAYDNQVLWHRRSSSIQIETDSPKRKSRSRRGSKISIINDDLLGSFSPRSTNTCSEPIADILEEFPDVAAKETARPKKMKKRKKVKEIISNVAESPIENKEEFQYIMEPTLNDIPTASTAVTPESSCTNILSMLSPQNSVCVTPASSIEMDINLSVEELRETTTNSSSTTTSSPSEKLSRTSSITNTTTPVDTFDILKDANFYPLF